ncbi:hypothetical protein HGRIS_010610 [Hohenbuehelia grisea]|uniref:Proteophosphoglycan ppg4 n=1 Tax=Hohenbuehelia grisea TaxID=104357 RepID=A0ABR3IXJ2_9AGAR
MAAPIARPRQNPASRHRSRESTDALRASVLDAALQLGLTANPRVANWLFNDPVEEEDEEEEREWEHPISPSLTSASTDESSASPYTPPSAPHPLYWDAFGPAAKADTRNLNLTERFDAGVPPLIKHRVNTDREAASPFPFLSQPPEQQEPAKASAKGKLRKKHGPSKDSGYASEKEGYVSEGVGYDTDASGYMSSSGKKKKKGRRFFGLGGSKKGETDVEDEEGEVQSKSTPKKEKKDKDKKDKKSKKPKAKPEETRPSYETPLQLPVHVVDNEPLMALPPIAERFATTLPGVSREGSRNVTPTLPPLSTPTQARPPLDHELPSTKPVAHFPPFLARSITPPSHPPSPAPLVPAADLDPPASSAPALAPPPPPLTINKKPSRSAFRFGASNDAANMTLEPERKMAISYPLTRDDTPLSPPSGPLPPPPSSFQHPRFASPQPREASLDETPHSDNDGPPTPSKLRPTLAPIITSGSGNVTPAGPSPIPSSAFLVPSPGFPPSNQLVAPSTPSATPPTDIAESPARRSPSSYLPSSTRTGRVPPPLSPASFHAHRLPFAMAPPPSPPPTGPLPPPPMQSDIDPGSMMLSASAPGSRAGSRAPSPSPLSRGLSQSGQRGREAPFPARPVNPGLAARRPSTSIKAQRRAGVFRVPVRAQTVDDSHAEGTRRRKQVAFEVRVEEPSGSEDEMGTDEMGTDEGAQVLSYRLAYDEPEARRTPYSPHIRWATRGDVPKSPSLVELDDERIGIRTPSPQQPTLRHTASQPNLSSQNGYNRASGSTLQGSADEKYIEDDDASMYPDEDRTAGRSTMYFIDDDDDIDSPILDGAQSGAVRERFVRQVMRWQDTANTADAPTMPLPAIPTGVGRGAGRVVGPRF